MIDLSSKAKQIVKRPFKSFGIVLLAILLLYFAIINPILNKIEKNSFEDAYAHIDGLSAEMQAVAGKAEEIKTLKSCGYSGQTFDRGWRSCAVSIDMYFPSFDLQKSNEYFKKASKLISDEPTASVYNKNSTEFEEKDYFQQIFTQSFKYKAHNCQIGYENLGLSKQSDIIKERGTGLSVKIICFKEARAEHYPVND